MSLATIQELAVECGAVAPSLDVQQQQTRVVARVLAEVDRYRRSFAEEEGATEEEARSKLTKKLAALLHEQQQQLRAKSHDVANYARRAEVLARAQ